MSNNHTDLSVIIPSFNTAALVVECIDSILSRSWRHGIEIIVVDNGSQDGTPARIAARFPQARVLALPTNRGYGGACNAGAEHAQGEFLMFLNSDTRVQEGSLDVVVDSFRQSSDLTAAACHELAPNGETVLGCRSHHTLRSGVSFLSGYRIFRAEGNRYQIAGWDRKDDRWVDNVSGFAWAIRREVFRTIGGFDEKLFLYFEEQDMATRLHQAGHRIRYLSQAKIIHLNARSTVSLGAFLRRRQWVESFVALRQKHGTSTAAWTDRLILYPFLVLWWLGHCMKRGNQGESQ